MTKTDRGKFIQTLNRIKKHFISLLLIAAILATIIIMAAAPVRAIIATEHPDAGAYDQWEEGMQARIADPLWRKEQDTLHKKHGLNHVIIYEHGEEPYYLDKRGGKHRFN